MVQQERPNALLNLLQAKLNENQVMATRVFEEIKEDGAGNNESSSHNSSILRQSII